MFTDIERDYLASQPLGRLATVSEVGLPQNNPVGFAFNEIAGTIDIGGRAMGATRKFANVAATRIMAWAAPARHATRSASAHRATPPG